MSLSLNLSLGPDSFPIKTEFGVSVGVGVGDRTESIRTTEVKPEVQKSSEFMASGFLLLQRNETKKNFLKIDQF